MAFVPPPPGTQRGRLPSSPETWQPIADLQAEVAALKVQVSAVAAAVATQGAGVKHQTIQLIIAGVVTCVTAVVGARVVAPSALPAQPAPSLSAYDRALAACKELHDEPARLECVVRVARDALGTPPR